MLRDLQQVPCSFHSGLEEPGMVCVPPPAQCYLHSSDFGRRDWWPGAEVQTSPSSITTMATTKALMTVAPSFTQISGDYQATAWSSQHSPWACRGLPPPWWHPCASGSEARSAHIQVQDKHTSLLCSWGGGPWLAGSWAHVPPCSLISIKWIGLSLQP